MVVVVEVNDPDREVSQIDGVTKELRVLKQFAAAHCDLPSETNRSRLQSRSGKQRK